MKTLQQYKLTIIAYIFCGLLLNACFFSRTPTQKIEFYTLEYPTPKQTIEPQLPFTIRVMRFSVAPTYNSDRIIYKKKEYTRNTYHYHKWRANPADLITYFLARDIKHTGKFKAVTTTSNQIPITHILEGAIEEFYELDGHNSWNAVLKFTTTLLTQNEPDISKRIIYQKTYSKKYPCSKRHPRYLAKAMSLARQSLSNKVILDIYEHLKNLP